MRYINGIESLTDYILVAQDKPLIEHFQKQSGGQWEKTELEGLQTVFRIDSIECEIALAELYDSVKFSA